MLEYYRENPQHFTRLCEIASELGNFNKD